MHPRLKLSSPSARNEDSSDTGICTPLLSASMADLASVYPQVGDTYFMGNIYEHAVGSGNEVDTNKDPDRCQVTQIS